VIDIAARKVAEKTYTRILDAAATPTGLRAFVADAEGKSLQVIDPVSDRVVRELGEPATNCASRFVTCD
jgi:hypothetical protein